MDEVTKPDAHPAVRRPDCVWGKHFNMCLLPSRFVAQVLPLGCKYFLWVEFHLWSSKVHPGGLWTACPQVGQVVLWPGHEQGWGGALAESGVSLSCHSTWWPVLQLSLALVLLLIGDARMWGSFAHQWSELQGDPVSEWEWVSAIPDEWTPQSLSFLQSLYHCLFVLFDWCKLKTTGWGECYLFVLCCIGKLRRKEACLCPVWYILHQKGKGRNWLIVQCQCNHSVHHVFLCYVSWSLSWVHEWIICR